MLDTALQLAQRGFHVFPLAPKSKVPLFSRSQGGKGCLDATTDLDQIRQWWTDNPDANIGIHPAPSGHIVIDLDVKDGVDGPCVYDLLWGGPHPDDMVVHTPSGGMHIYYRLPEGASPPGPSSQSRLGQGIDVRCHNSYVVAPGCALENGEYTGQFRPPRLASADLVRTAGKAMAREHNAGEWLAEPDPPGALPRANRVVAEWRAKIGTIHTGDRSNTFFAWAARLRDFAIAQDTALELLRPLNDALASPLDEDRFETTIANAYHYAKKPAGTVVGAGADVFKTVKPTPVTLANSSWPLYTPHDMDQRPDPKWLIPGVLPEGTLSILYGPRSSRKTFVALDVALSLATGREWNGIGIAEPCRVLYVAGEGIASFKFRRQAWEAHHQLYPQDDFVFSDRLPKVVDPASVAEFVNAIKPFKFKFIVLDTLTRLIAGIDNGTEGNSKAFEMLEFIREQTGAHVMVVGHTGKDVDRGLRGGSDLEDNVDTTLAVKLDGAHTIVEIVKQKDASADLPPWVYRAHNIDPDRMLVIQTSVDLVKSAQQIEDEYRTQTAKIALGRMSQRVRVVRADHLAIGMAAIMSEDCDVPMDPAPLVQWLQKVGVKQLKEYIASDKPLEFITDANPGTGQTASLQDVEPQDSGPSRKHTKSNWIPPP